MGDNMARQQRRIITILSLVSWRYEGRRQIAKGGLDRFADEELRY